MDISKKLRYIFDYYKLHLIIALIVLYIVFFFAYRQITHRDTLLYTALVNIEENDSMKSFLREDFLKSQQINTRKNDLLLYTGLYLTSDAKSEYHEYSYASEMKILGSLETKKLDIVLMDRESFDAFCANGYLLELDSFLREKSPEFYRAHSDELVKNTIIISDNSDEVRLDKNARYSAKTKEAVLGLDLSESSFFDKYRFNKPVYLGVIKNTSRGDMSVKYIEYLYN